MAVIESRRKIGIFCHGGTQNLGDEALFAAVIQNVRLRMHSAEIIGFTINPVDSQRRHGLACFPIRQAGKIASSPVLDSSPASSGASDPSPSTLAKLKEFCGWFLRSVIRLARSPRFSENRGFSFSLTAA